MADVVKTKGTLSIEAEFTDGDTRTITIENPVANLSASAVNAVASLAGGVLIGDKEGADFFRFKSAKKSSVTVTYHDLTPAS